LHIKGDEPDQPSTSYGILHFLSSSLQELRYGEILARVGIHTADGVGHREWEFEKTRNEGVSDSVAAGEIVVHVCRRPQWSALFVSTRSALGGWLMLNKKDWMRHMVVCCQYHLPHLCRARGPEAKKRRGMHWYFSARKMKGSGFKHQSRQLELEASSTRH